MQRERGRDGDGTDPSEAGGSALRGKAHGLQVIPSLLRPLGLPRQLLLGDTHACVSVQGVWAYFSPASPN